MLTHGGSVRTVFPRNGQFTAEDCCYYAVERGTWRACAFRMLHDLRYSFRLLFKSPGFTVVAVLSLALGIAAATTIFSVVYAGLLRELPYREPNRLVRIQAFNSLERYEAPATSSDVLDWRAANHVFEQIEMFLSASSPVTISAPGLPERVKFSVRHQRVLCAARDTAGAGPRVRR